MGRPTLYSQELAAEIIQRVAQGGGIVRAAQACGISRQTVWNWRRQGRIAGEGPLHEFDRAVTKLEAEQLIAAEHEVKKLSREAKNENTRLNASIFLLERRAPEDYSQKQVMEAQLRHEIAIELLEFFHANVSDSAYREILLALDGTSAAGSPAALPG